MTEFEKKCRNFPLSSLGLLSSLLSDRERGLIQPVAHCREYKLKCVDAEMNRRRFTKKLLL